MKFLISSKNSGILLAAALLAGALSLPVSAEEGNIEEMLFKSALAAGREEGENPVSEEPVSPKENLILLTWQEDPESVRYEVEIFRGLPDNLDRNEPVEIISMTTGAFIPTRCW